MPEQTGDGAPAKAPGGGDLIAIGVIRRPKGLQGDCYVNAFGTTLPSLKPPVTLVAGPDSARTQQLVLCSLRVSPQGYLCRFEGRQNMDSAGDLRGFYLFCSRDMLPKLPGGKHYHFELEGLTVVTDGTGQTVGTVISVQSFPTADALEVRKDDGSTILVSMTAGVIQAVDVQEGVIRVSGSAIEEIV
jgi:16S rRNA processing protein RimM